MKTGTILSTGVAALALFGLEGQAFGEPSKFRPGTVNVLAAARLVNETGGHQFRLGQDLLLTVQRSPYVQQKIAKGFQARIFTLARGENIPSPWAFFDPCLIFYSLVLNAPTQHGRMNLGRLSGLNYLNVEGNGVFPGRYLIVFEEKADSGRMIRLNRQDVRRYFSQSLYIEVLPTKTYTRRELERRAGELGLRSSELRQEAHVNSPAFRCYIYRSVQAPEGEEEQLAFEEKCEESSPT